MSDLFSQIADPLTGGLFGLVGGLFQQDNSAQQVQQQENFQQSELNQTEAYDTQMSNTAYQRQTADMKAAGINPMLSVMGGGGGGGASAPTVSAPQGANAATSMPNIVQSALSSAAAVSNIQQQQANVQQTAAGIPGTSAKSDLAQRALGAQVQETQANANTASAKATIAQADAGPYSSWFGKNILPWIDVLSGHASQSAQAVSDSSKAVAAVAGE